MTNATLCTTNSNEPWAANVNFQVDGSIWRTTLKTQYTHFKNLVVNKNTVVVYKNGGLEVIMKAAAELPTNHDTESVDVDLHITWLRIVENGDINDLTDEKSIIQTINSKVNT